MLKINFNGKVTIEIGPEDFATVMRGLGMEAEIRSKIETSFVKQQEEKGLANANQIGALAEAIDSFGWPTCHLMDLLIKFGPEPMPASKLLKMEVGDNRLTERAIASRIGGARRVCARLGVDEIIIVKKDLKTGKQYSVRESAVPVFNEILAKWEAEYDEWLSEHGFDAPEDLINCQEEDQ